MNIFTFENHKEGCKIYNLDNSWIVCGRKIKDNKFNGLYLIINIPFSTKIRKFICPETFENKEGLTSLRFGLNVRKIKGKYKLFYCIVKYPILLSQS